MSTTYWVAIPGSNDPPLGPLSPEEILAQLKAGKIHSDGTVCRVGESEWRPVNQLLPKQEPSTPRGSVFLPRSSIEQLYSNMKSVGTSTSSWGMILKIFGFVTVVGSVGLFAMALTLKGNFPLYTVGGGGILLFALGLALVGIGTLVAAVGETVLALKDIAVNTRIVADRAEASDGR